MYTDIVGLKNHITLYIHRFIQLTHLKKIYPLLFKSLHFIYSICIDIQQMI